MPNFADIYASPATKTFATSGDMVDLDAFKTSIATAITAQSYSGVALNGAVAGTALAFEQKINVTTSAHASTYNTGVNNPIVITYKDRDNATQTLSLLLTAANGGETITSTVGIKQLVSIAIPAQNDALGAFTFGTGDVVVPTDHPIRQIRGGADGNIAVTYQGSFTDTLPVLTGEKHDVLAIGITSASTTFPVTLFA